MNCKTLDGSLGSIEASADSFYGNQKQPKQRSFFKSRPLTPYSRPSGRLQNRSPFGLIGRSSNSLSKMENQSVKQLFSSNEDDVENVCSSSPSGDQIIRTWREARNASLSVEKKFKSINIRSPAERQSTILANDDLVTRSGPRRVYGRLATSRKDLFSVTETENTQAIVQLYTSSGKEESKDAAQIPDRVLKPIIPMTQNQTSPVVSKNSKKSTVRPIPLVNPKNSCYVNSVIQALVVFPDLVDDLNKHVTNATKENKIAISLLKLLQDYEIERKRPDDEDSKTDVDSRIVALRQAVGEESSQFLSDRQQDAGEFFACIMDALDMNDWFAVTSVCTLKCCKCGKQSEPQTIHDTTTYVQAPEKVNEGFPKLQDLLLSLISESESEKRDLKCSNDDCDSGEVDVVKKFEKMPKVLMVQLSRTSMTGTKIDAQVYVDEKLSFNDPSEAGSEALDYRLHSVICHVGPSVTSGHYYCLSFNPEDRHWYDCDDCDIKKTDFEQVTADGKANGFCFFYRREK